MEIRNLSTFLEVAERRSFSRAADALGYTQSTVSAQIKQLEAAGCRDGDTVSIYDFEFDYIK